MENESVWLFLIDMTSSDLPRILFYVTNFTDIYSFISYNFWLLSTEELEVISLAVLFTFNLFLET